MKRYEVWQHGETLGGLLKTYPFKIQAIIYCWTHGYVYQGHGWYFLDPSIKIIEKEEK